MPALAVSSASEDQTRHQCALAPPLGDDEAQQRTAANTLEGAELVAISVHVLCEFTWVCIGAPLQPSWTPMPLILLRLYAPERPSINKICAASRHGAVAQPHGTACESDGAERVPDLVSRATFCGNYAAAGQHHPQSRPKREGIV